MLKVAILDDYQNVSQHYVNLKKLSGKYEIKVFSEPFKNEEEAIENLRDLKKAIKSKNEKKLEKIFRKTKKIRKEIIEAGQDISKPDFGRKQN